MKIFIVIPCYNEEKTVEKVVHDFQRVLPEATIYVYNNNSTDRTAELAKAAGAIGLFESKYGERVKVYTMGEYSKEICGGPHAKRTGELGTFKIKKEEASSAGVRRIKAVLE